MKYEPGAAPRISLEQIEREIRACHYVLPNEAVYQDYMNGYSAQIPDPELRRITLCILVMRSGAIVIGKSIVAHPANFDVTLGRKAARDDAIRQCWELMGFALRDRIGRMDLYIDRVGVTRTPDGEEAFEQIARHSVQPQDGPRIEMAIAMRLTPSNPPEEVPAGTAWQVVLHDGIPLAPGFVIPDGRSLSRLQYPELFATLGTRYCKPGDDPQTFRIPDWRDGVVEEPKTATGDTTPCETEPASRYPGLVEDPEGRN